VPYEQVFRPDLDLVYTRFAAQVGLEELRRCAISTFRDERYRAGMRELLDFRATTTPDPRLGFETIHAICETQATWVRHLRDRGHVVAVGGSDLVYGLIRIYMTLLEQQGLVASPCRDWATACRTLGVDPTFDRGVRRAEG